MNSPASTVSLRSRWLTFFLMVGLCSGFAAPLMAAPADDEYTFGLQLYGQKRWELTAETLQNYLKNYPTHDKVPLARLYLAQSYVNLKKYQEAREILREFLKQHPQNKNVAQATYRVAECSYFLDDYQVAGEEFEQFLKKFPTDPLTEWALPYQADAYLRNNQPEEAARVFQASLKQFPEGRFQEDSRYGLARSLEMLNQTEEAIAEYEKLIVLPEGRRVPEAYFNLGMLYFQQRNFARAAETFLSLSEKYPANPLVPLAQLNAGYAYYSLKNWEAALPQFEQAQKSPTYRIPARYWIAQTYKGQRQLAEAKAILLSLQQDQQALDEEYQPRVLYQLAECQFQLGEYNSALEGFASYRQQWPQGENIEQAWLHNIETHLLLGQLTAGWNLAEEKLSRPLSAQGRVEHQLLQARLLSSGENRVSAADTSPAELPAWPESLKRAEQRLQKADQILTTLNTQSKTNDSIPRSLQQQITFHAARVKQERNEPEKVVELLQPLTTQLPAGEQLGLPEAWIVLGTAQLALKQWQAVIDATDQFLKTASAEALGEQAHVLRLNAFLMLPDLDQAEKELNQLNRMPAFAAKKTQASYQLAEASYRQSDWQRAERWYQQALTSAVDAEWKIKAISGLGWTQFESGQFERSAQTFDELKSQFPDSQQVAADAGYMQGMAQLKANQPAQAAEHFWTTAQKFRSTAAEVNRSEVSLIAYRSAREAARTYRQIDEIEKSAAAYQLAYEELRKQPESQQASLGELLDEWALLHYENEEFDKADDVFRILVQEVPQSNRADDALLSLGESAYISGKTVEAQKTFEQVLNMPVADPYVKRRARYQLVLIASERQDSASVQKYALEYLQAIDSTEVELTELGEIESQLIQSYLDAGKLKEARERLEKFLPQVESIKQQPAPDWAPGMYVLGGEIARLEKKYAQTRQYFKTLKTRFPESPEVDQLEVIVGRTYIAEADFAQALQAFQNVLNRASGKKTLAAAQSQFYTAEVALMKMDYTTALKEFIRLAVLFPGYPELQMAALYQAGQCDEALGNANQALENYETLVRLYPESPFATKAQERIQILKTQK